MIGFENFEGLNPFLFGLVVIVMAIAFGVPGWIKNKLEKNESYSTAELAATILYSVIVGFLSILLGVVDVTQISTLGAFLENYSTIFTPIWTTYFFMYTGLLYFFNKIIVPAAVPMVQNLFVTVDIKQKRIGSEKLPATPIASFIGRHMDQTSRDQLVSDLPVPEQEPTLACVDEAEAMIPNPIRYAIAVGAWEYLIENGEDTGSKHYWFKRWYGSHKAVWKPITMATLENIRSTGKWPPYSQLT